MYGKDNPKISIAEVRDGYPEYKNFTLKSQKSRLSSTRSIIKYGQEIEALSCIINSSRLNEEDRVKAAQLLSAFK